MDYYKIMREAEKAKEQAKKAVYDKVNAKGDAAIQNIIEHTGASEEDKYKIEMILSTLCADIINSMDELHRI